jgi:hypothetical protein
LLEETGGNRIAVFFGLSDFRGEYGKDTFQIICGQIPGG